MASDIILTGGRVYLGLAEGFAEAIAIKNGRIAAVGSAADIEAWKGLDTRVVDLRGRCALPGLNDAHMHLLPIGLGMKEINLRTEDGVDRIDEILARVAKAAAQAKAGEWIRGRGYDHNELAEKRHPTAEELDQVAPDHPVFIQRTCGHIGVANTAALRAGGIGSDTPSPEGGLIERRDGELTGMLAERAMRFIIDVMPKASHEELVEAIERGGRFMLEQGFTSVMDAGVGMNMGMPEVLAYETAAEERRLPVRTWACLYGDPGGIVEEAHTLGYRAGREVGLLRYGAAKVFTDGSAGSLTAAMSTPYQVGDPENHGILCFSNKEVHERLRHFHELGYQLAIHAIGDVAIEQVLSGIEKADSAAYPIAGRRHRIEHCGFLTQNQMRRMSAAGIYPVPQPAFIYEFGDLYITNLGLERAQAGYPMRGWLKSGQFPAASSDAPVCSTDPFKNMYTMVTRKTRRGTVIAADQTLTMAEAVHAYTYCGAFSQFAESDLGRLVPGQKADIAILSEDIFTGPVDRLEADVRCDMTILNGAVVFDRSN